MTQQTNKAERGLCVTKARLIHSSGEIDEYPFQPGMLNILTGVRNSSKTTTLRVIDYCLGDRDNAAKALGAAVADEYVEVSTELRIHGRPYTLTRSLVHGRMNKIQINDLVVTADRFSDWILNELGWPNLRIPLGLNPATASELTPLSFRSTLRHVHRNEGSWIAFANKEQEFTRRAVTSQLLGFATTRFDNARREFDLARAKQRLDEAQAADREAHESSLQAVTAISDSLHLPHARTSAQVAAARDQIRAELETIRQRRQELTNEISTIEASDGSEGAESTAGYDSSLTAAYGDVTGRLKRATDDVANLHELHEEHQRSARTVQAEIGRMERLSTSIEVFDALPVRMCPACEQDVSPSREHPAGSCHVCFQAVDDDTRRRRAQIEIRSLKSELEDLDDVIQRTGTDLIASRGLQQELQASQAQLAQRLNAERSAQLAPFVAELENIAAQIARLEQKLTALPAIETILQRRDEARQALVRIEQRVQEIDSQPQSQATHRLSPSERCHRFAERMNGFLANYADSVWLSRDVSIRDSDLTFYVGSRPWDQALGAEAKVLFFLAYSYATLFIERDLDQECAFPGVLLLDNPYQQGIDDDVVRNVLTEIAEAAHETGTQVISTQVPEPPTNPDTIQVLRMPNVYATP
ncbi:hypothetical protein ACFRAO_43865 [Streptomyces sp. NPDC056656]|uniref:hypothetical protein n=1 Tax=Streptomyces sp. NPDC056656 TaxID=3345895 RepID=UPI0036A52A64